MAEREVGILITVKDDASRGLANVGAAVDGLKTKVKANSAEVKALPEKFGRAAAAASLLGSSVGQAGGSFGMMAQKATGLAAVVATGGPLGIAVAAITVSVGAVSWAVGKWNEETEKAIARNKELAQITSGVQERLRATQSEVERLSRELQAGGDEALEKYLERTQQIEQAELNLLRTNAQLNDAIGRYRDRTGEINKVVSEEIDKLKVKAAAEQEIIDNLKEAKKLELELANATEARGKAEGPASRPGAKRAPKPEAADEYVNYEIEEKLRTEQMLQDMREEQRAIEADKAAADEQAALERSILLKQTYLDREVAMRAAYYDWQVAEQEKATQRSNEMFSQMSQTGMSAVNSLAVAFERYADARMQGDKDAGKAFRNQALGIIVTAAFTAAAKAIEAYAGIPFLGPILGAAASVAAIGTILAFKSQVPNFYFGKAPRGVPGTDSIPALIAPGEGVVPTPIMRSIEMGGQAVGAERFVGESGGGGGQRQLVINMGFLEKPGATAMRRFTRDSLAESDYMQRRGLV